MRVLRRILGCPRFDAFSGRSEKEVRQVLKVDSIDCFLLRRRLTYFGNTISKQPKALMALLGCSASKVDGCTLPWLSLVKENMATLRLAQPTRLAELGSPFEAFSLWIAFVQA